MRVPCADGIRHTLDRLTRHGEQRAVLGQNPRAVPAQRGDNRRLRLLMQGAHRVIQIGEPGKRARLRSVQMEHRVQGEERRRPFRRDLRAARPRRVQDSINRGGFEIIHQQTAGLFLDFKPADIAVGIALGGVTRHPRGIEAVFRAVDGKERPLAPGLDEAVAAAVRRVRQIDGLREGERLEPIPDESAEHALKTDRGDERDRRAAAPQNVGGVVGAAADGELLAVGMQVFLGMGKVIDADDDVHAGRADDEHLIFHNVLRWQQE